MTAVYKSSRGRDGGQGCQLAKECVRRPTAKVGSYASKIIRTHHRLKPSRILVGLNQSLGFHIWPEPILGFQHLSTEI